MLNKILLPLDGSDRAEAALPYVEALVPRVASEVELLHVCDRSHGLSHNMHRLYLEKRAELIEKQINMAELNSSKAKIQAVLKFGDFRVLMPDYVCKHNVDLVMMVAHGFTDLKTKITGSVVDEVFKSCGCPMILLKPKVHSNGNHLFQNIMVSLDGTSQSEVSLPFASELASKLNANLTLLSVAREEFDSTQDIDILEDRQKANQRLSQEEHERLTKYLNNIAHGLFKECCSITTKVITCSDCVKAIAKMAKDSNIDLLIISTSSPVTAWRPNSVAHRLLNLGQQSMMIIRQASLSKGMVA